MREEEGDAAEEDERDEQSTAQGEPSLRAAVLHEERASGRFRLDGDGCGDCTGRGLGDGNAVDDHDVLGAVAGGR